MAQSQSAAAATDGDATLEDRLAGGALAALIFALHVSPRGGWLVLILLTVLLFGLLMRSGWRLADATPPSSTAISFLAFGVLAFAGALWAVAPIEAVKAGGVFLLQVGLAIVAADSAARLPASTVRQLCLGLMIGFAAGLGFILFEAVTKLWLHRFVFNTFPVLSPGDDQHLHVVKGRIVRIDVSNLKRNMAASALVFWPVALLAARRITDRLGVFPLPAIILLAAVTSVLSTHESSVLALGASLVALAAASLWFRWTWRSIVALWCLLTLLIVPVMLWQFDAKLYESNWLQFSARHRMVIWGYSAKQIAQAPVLGIGAGSGRILDDARTTFETVIDIDGKPLALSTAAHQHDVYLQTWYEMGGLGATVLAIAGLTTLWRIFRLPAGVRSYALAAFVSAMIMVSTSYGLWQEWFEASIAIAAVMTALSIRFVDAGAFVLQQRRSA